MNCDTLLGSEHITARGLAEATPEFNDGEALAHVLVPDPEGVVFHVAREKALQHVTESKSWKELVKGIEAEKKRERNEITLIALNYLLSRIQTVLGSQRRGI